MNWVDIAIGIVFLLCVWSGWHRGFIFGSLDLLVWAGSLILGYLFYPYTARGLDKIVELNVWLLPLAFILTTIIARILLGIITGLFTRSIPPKIYEGTVNKLLGIIPGAINGWIFSVILSALLLALPLKDSVTRETRNSRLAPRLAMQSEWVNKKLAPVFDDAVRQTMNSLTVNPKSHDKVELSFKTTDVEVRSDLEAEMLKLVNEERAKEGLKPLTADPELSVVARKHSQDMFARGYFAHVNPDGKDPFDRMKDANVVFKTAGENLALAQTLQIAHTNLMNSPGHRANIMNPEFGRLGVGILDGGFYGLMISQEFRE
jgi:uncharacterized protein YkwD